MNRLVAVLLERPDLVDEAARHGQVTFDWLLDALGGALLTERERARLEARPTLRRSLAASYLSVVTGPQWETSLRIAEVRDDSMSSPWSVAMVPGLTSGMGLTLPQDSFPEVLLGLFRGPEERAWPILYNPARRSLVRIREGGHCDAVGSRGRCDSGVCGGCAAKQVYLGRCLGYGIVCRCAHDGEA